MSIKEIRDRLDNFRDECKDLKKEEKNVDDRLHPVFSDITKIIKIGYEIGLINQEKFRR